MTIPASITVSDVIGLLDRRYPPDLAESWDRVGLVLGEPTGPAGRVLFVVDCVPETVEEALRRQAQLIVAHHPLLLRGVSSVAPTTYKGRIVHRLIRAGIALYSAHTNADAANPGVADALAARVGLTDLRPLRPADAAAAAGSPDAGRVGVGSGRVGRLIEPCALAELAERVARALPATAWGVRAAGAPERRIETMAVCGGSGDAFLGDAAKSGVDAYLTADLRHHPVSEHLANGGPALLDAAHWATEWPWLDDVAAYLRASTGIETIVSDIDTDPWTVHVPSRTDRPAKEPRQ